MRPSPPTMPPAPLQSLTLKTGVSLGGLSDTDRCWALAVPALRLAVGTVCTEAEVNALLKMCLQQEGAFLHTDHVELRRWLVDSGWWVRDGYGHAYRARPVEELPPHLQPVAMTLSGWDVAAWVVARRQQATRQREARRQAWHAQQSAHEPPSRQES